MAENKTFYDIVKQYKGGLTLIMPSYDSTLPNKTVTIPYNVDRVRVPATFALGIYVDGALQQMYEQGYFKIEPEAAFKAEIAKVFAPVEDFAKIETDPQILEALKKGNRVKIKTLVEASEVNRENVLEIARVNKGDIPTSMIQYIEELFGVELTVDGE